MCTQKSRGFFYFFSACLWNEKESLFPSPQKTIALFDCPVYNIDKGITAHKGLTSTIWFRITTPSLAKVPGWFFYALNHYRQNVKTNVSNAKMNIPKAIKSLKSKCFISTTPILCKNRGQPPCNTVIPFSYHNTSQSFIAIPNPVFSAVWPAD